MSVKSCQIFAHRGANNEAAENTQAAFDQALCYAIDGMETDVQLSRDEVAVLWHDRFLDKVGQPGKHIDDFDFQQLQGMNFSAQFSSVGKPGALMTLQHFLNNYRKHCRLLIEIKNRDWEPRSRHDTKVKQTLAMIGTPISEEIMVSSFNLNSLIYAQQQCPGFPLIYNFEDDQTMADARHILTDHPFLRGLCLPITSLDDSMTKLLRDQGKCIAVYTCNTDEEINKALELKVDILITDIPQKALQMRNR